MLVSRGYSTSLRVTAVTCDLEPSVVVLKNVFGQKGRGDVAACHCSLTMGTGRACSRAVGFFTGASCNGRSMQLRCWCCPPCSPCALTLWWLWQNRDRCSPVFYRGEEEDRISEQSWDSRADLVPPLSVFEYTGLEFTLKVASRENDSFN